MSRPHTFTGPAGALSARIHGEGPVALVLHPHPLFGGTKGTRLVYALCKELASLGYQAVRFDFRGAGDSAGRYGHGEGEVADALAVAEALGPLELIVGFSFGGAVAARVAREHGCKRLILIAAPDEVRESTLRTSGDLPHVEAPCHLIWGTDDQQVGRPHVEALVACRPNLDVRLLAGADHFLTPTHHERVMGVLRRIVQ